MFDDDCMNRLVAVETKVDMLVSDVRSLRSDLFSKVLLPLIVVVGSLAGVQLAF